MILIRGIRGQQYAKMIKKDLVGCRDLLSALLDPPVTGYGFSDYYEKNLAKALLHFARNGATDIHNPEFLHSLLIDPYIPHIYLTYFHVLNENSLEWLENFEDDYVFIAINAQIDRITGMAIGTSYFGGRMSYVDSIHELSQDENVPLNAACLVSLESMFRNKADIIVPLQIYNTLAFSLMCRERDDRFTDIENEFRIIAYDCPEVNGSLIKQIPREAVISGRSGKIYTGILEAYKNSLFDTGARVLSDPGISLKEIVKKENGYITLDSSFKSINVREISADRWYIGDKNKCAGFIKKMLDKKPADIFIDRTIERTYKRDDIPDAVFVPGHRNVDY